jgi:pimeloyl-ACP methyl ester carboxylesterase
MERLVYRWTLHRKLRDAGRYARMACDIQRDSPVSSRTVGAQLKAASQFVPPNVSQRTLIVSSGQDRLVSPRCSRDLASFLGAPVREHAEAGHDLPLDDPAWLLEQIANWVEAPSLN